jgi:predicted Holliday junction resolvase-like endonuclease
MDSNLAAIFSELGQILAVCPCCGEIFYVSEARPYLAGKKPKSVVERLRADERRLDRLEESLENLENDLRERAAKAGLRTAKRLLKKIDPVFSGAGYDPQDVKVIFNPVTYVVFDGLAKGNLRKVMLMAREAEDVITEQVHRSIDRAVRSGNIEFKTLRVDSQGQVFSD